MARVGISLGSNLGDRLTNLRAALALLERVRSTQHLLVSSIYETEPVDCPPGSGAFYNAVIEIETDLPPLALLAETQAIEYELGRPGDHEINAPRTADLDLLYFGEERFEGPGLVLPHPRIFQRAFVVKPLAEIRPDLVPETARDAISGEGVRRIEEKLV